MSVTSCVCYFLSVTLRVTDCVNFISVSVCVHVCAIGVYVTVCVSVHITVSCYFDIFCETGYVTFCLLLHVSENTQHTSFTHISIWVTKLDSNSLTKTKN